MVEAKKEFDVFKGLLNGKQVATLSSDNIIECVQKRSLSQLGDSQGIRYVLHDGCDIRKPNSKELEHIGQVMSLSKQVINGYKTMNSVVVDIDNQGVSLLCHELYSNKMPNYIGQTTLNDSQAVSELREVHQQMLIDKTYINTLVLFRRNLKNSSELLKSTNPDLQVGHVFDREFDDDTNFEYIDSELKDVFVARLKANRLSHQTFSTTTPTGKISKRLVHYKLIDKIFANSSVYEIDKILIKGVKYQNVQAQIEWETLKIGQKGNQKSYNVVRITLLKDGKPLFAQPMLLLTNNKVQSAEAAKSIYMAYLLRSKIEVVFKFLKQNLGWEAFQVRDFNSIKNLLALAFFLIGYFPELENELKDHPMTIHLCQLAKSKGKTTLHFLLNGLEMLTNFQQVSLWMKQNDISKEQIDQFLQEIGVKSNSG
jgi:Transposase DDE domain